MTNQEAHAQAFKGDAEGYARGKAEAFADAGDLLSVKAARETCQRIFSDPVLIYAVDTTLKNTPRVTARPVKRGRCEYCQDGKSFIGARLMLGNDCQWHDIRYCPNCGADMRGGNDGT
jgi:hypothetical protein